jgi:hypothetical protein
MSERKAPHNKIERLFQHAGTFCLVSGTDLGHRNGYMRVPDDHPWHKLLMDMTPKPPTDYDELVTSINAHMDTTGYTGPRLPTWPKDMTESMNSYEARRSATWYDWFNEHIDIHGGWTYANTMEHENFEYWFGPSGDGVPPGIWVGFDTAHYMDSSDPGLMRELGADEDLIASYSKAWRDGHVWTVDEVAAEISRAAEEMDAARILEGAFSAKD